MVSKLIRSVVSVGPNVGETQPMMRSVHVDNLTSILNELAMHDRATTSFHHIDGVLPIRPKHVEFDE